MLWLCSLISADNVKGMLSAVTLLDIIDEHLDLSDSARVDSFNFSDPLSVIDGRLTRLEAIPLETRESILSEVVSRGIYESVIPFGFAHFLHQYTDAPGLWLTSPWIERGLAPDKRYAENYLKSVVDVSYGDRDLVSTRARFIAVSRHFKAGRVKIFRDVFENSSMRLWPQYPNNLTPDERAMVESETRATYSGILASSEGDMTSPSVVWAQQFWRANWKLYSCRVPDLEAPSGDASGMDRFKTMSDSRLDVLRDRLLTAAANADPDIYAPDRFEVLTGIAVRAVRLVGALVQTPALWSNELGAPILRSVAEAQIIFYWLQDREKTEPSIYNRFKDYGRGRLKLLLLHYERYVDALGDAADEEALNGLRALSNEVNSDTREELQNISIDSTFSKISLRDMALKIDLEDVYRFIVAPASSTTHGDWASLDRYALAQCINPLHRFHRVPRGPGPMLLGPELVVVAFNSLEALIDAYVASIGASIGATEVQSTDDVK